MKSCNYPVWADVPNGNYDVSVVGCDGSQETIFRGHAYDPSGTAQVDLSNIIKYHFDLDNIYIPELESIQGVFGSLNITGNDVIFVNGRFYTVGTTGGFASSTDGKSWTVKNIGFDNRTLNGLAYGDGKFVTVGASGSLAVSEDNGETWELLNVTTASLFGVTYGDGRFVATSAGGMLLISDDGYNWTIYQTSGNVTIYKVIYANGIYVAVGNANGSGKNIYYSTDAETWSEVATSPAFIIQDITYGDGKFVLVGSQYSSTSTDGISWTPASASFTVTMYGVSYLNSAFYAVGSESYIWRSTDGTTWSIINGPGASVRYNQITYGNNVYVAVGANGNVLISTDGITWENITQPNIIDIIYAGGLYVAVGQAGAILTSTNGIDWEDHSLSISDSFQGITYTDNGVFVAVGTTGIIYRSVNGIDWARTESGIYATLYDVTYSDGILVAVSSGVTLTSDAQGQIWQQNSFSGNTMYCVASGNGLFVAGCANRTVATSTDGINWTFITIPFTSTTAVLRDIVYANGLFVVVGNREGIAISEDGSSWNIVHDGPSTNVFYTVSYNASQDIYFIGGAGRTLYTRDFITYDEELYPGDIRASYYEGSTLILGGISLLSTYSVNYGLLYNNTGFVVTASVAGQLYDIAYDYNTGYISDIGDFRVNNDPVRNELIPGQYITSGYYSSRCSDSHNVAFSLDGALLESTTLTGRDFLVWFDTALIEAAEDSILSVGVDDETAEYKVISGCDIRFVLYYVNKYGAVDWLIMKGNYQESFQNSPYDIDTNYNRTYPDRFQNTRIQSTATRRFSLNTGFLTDEESAKIDHLFLSTRVWLHDLEDGLIYAALIRDNSFQVKKHRDNRSYINYTINVEQSQDVIRR